MAATTLSSADTLDAWVRSLPCEGEVFRASAPRPYKRDEETYDAQPGNDLQDGMHGAGLVALARESGADFSGAALEIGCGTGKASVGLVASRAYPLMLITDASPAFVEIAHRKCTPV